MYKDTAPWWHGESSAIFPMLTALQIGKDSNLLKTRGGVVETAGLRVITACGVMQALDRITSTPPDVAILCHTLAHNERAEIAATVHRRNPHALVVLIAQGRFAAHSPDEGFDAVLGSDPALLVEGLRRILPPSGP